MFHFCTITTSDHLYKTFALFDSLKEQNSEVCFHLLCIDNDVQIVNRDGLKHYKMSFLSENINTQIIHSKYKADLDKIRWSLKPIFLKSLLKSGIEKVIYLDNDLYFFSNYNFLFDLLDNYNFLLTPHYFSKDSSKSQNWFEANYRVGLFNAGFIGVHKSATEYLDWWASCCAYRCEKSAFRGMYDDQKYLDLMPVINPDAHIVRHKGCNVADWNRSEVKREIRDGQLYLDGQYPLVFIHFNYTTIGSIHNGAELLLKPYFEKYFENLQKYYPHLERRNMFGPSKLIDRIKYKIWKFFTDRNL